MFGSFNNFAKVTDRAISAWSEILAAVPNARLMIKTHGLGDDLLRQRITQRFADKGIDESRLTLLGKDLSLSAHLARYGEIDIALDTFPYCGTTTTCEALWMGAAVITLAGESHRERVGVSLLRNIGLAEMIAETPEEYVRIAVTLAKHVERLGGIRETMRSRFEASPLRDEAGYAREFEAAIRTAWANWCAK
jgi:predicted O-linked N-acetylglucosamine transferase (SPINDLY family)